MLGAVGRGPIANRTRRAAAESLMPKRSPSLIAVFSELLREAKKHRLSGLSAEVTYFAVLSLFPGLLIVAGALGWLQSFVGHRIAEQSEAAVVGVLKDVLIDRAPFVVRAVQDLFTRPSKGLLTSSALIAFLTLSTGFAAGIGALDLVYGVPERRSWINLRLSAFALALGSIVMVALILLLVVAGPLIGGAGIAKQLGMGDLFTFLWDWLRGPVAFALLVAWATTVYYVAPNQRTPWRMGLPGGAAAAILWLAVSYGLRLYLHLAAKANEILGVLGGGLLLMIWFYLLSLVLLLGGTLNAVLARRARS
jgi:membrane protein